MEPTDTPEGALVYADWLLSQGNLQGEVISLQLARQSAQRTPAAQRALRLREEELLAKHGAELAGPVPKETELCWRGGFVREASFALHSVDELARLEVLSRPAFALLERLSLKADWNAPLDAPQVVKALSGLKRLSRFALELYSQKPLDLTALPAGLTRLSLKTRSAPVTLGALPELTELRLHSNSIEGVSPGAQPKLQRVLTDAAGTFSAFRNLELHLDPNDDFDFWSTEPRRVVLTVGDRDADELPAGKVVARTDQQNGERAFLLFEAAEPELRRALERLKKVPLDGVITSTHRTFTLGGRDVTAVELRSSEPQPSLLRLLANDLAGALPRGVLEAAVSNSSSSALFRGHERHGTSITSWVLGRKDFRRAVDRLFAFDPGLDAFDDVLLELDGVEPVALKGPLPTDVWQLTCCTPVEPGERLTLYEGDYDEEDESEDALDQGDDDDDGYDDEPERPQPEQVVVALVDAEEDEADPEDDPDEPHRDATDADVEEVLTQSPVEPEEDGLEPEPETGLEPDQLDFDGMSAEATCEACRRNAVSETCYLCATDVCEACLAIEMPPTCKECRGVAAQPTSPSTETTPATPAPRPSQPSGVNTRSTKLTASASAKPTATKAARRP